MEGWSELKDAIRPNCFFARIDLKDAYLSIRMHKDSQPFLSFVWRGCSYCWTRLPFRLKSSPRVFTKLMKPVVATLRKEGIVLIVYLDDFLLIDDSPTRLEAHVQRTTTLLHSLGYTVNEEKSALSPSQQVTFLGYDIDSTSMRLSLPPEKLGHIKSSILTLVPAGSVSLRGLSSVLGKLNAITTIVRSVRYYCASIRFNSKSPLFQGFGFGS